MVVPGAALASDPTSVARFGGGASRVFVIASTSPWLHALTKSSAARRDGFEPTPLVTTNATAAATTTTPTPTATYIHRRRTHPAWSFVACTSCDSTPTGSTPMAMDGCWPG